MMARICLYPLFLLFVFALGLDSYEAAFPPPGYITRCLLVVEAEDANGIYRYDPDEEVSSGYPKMVKLDLKPGQPFDYNRVDEDYYMAYWWRLTGKALQFTKGWLRLSEVIHPCKYKAEAELYFEIIKAIIAAPFRGYAQLTNELVNVECVPLHGTLQLKEETQFRLPVYHEMKTAYACVTWLREVEATSGVKSHATAAQVNPRNKTCTLFYVDHFEYYERDSGKNNYCFLHDTESPGEFPGFYTGCRIYVEDPVFAGLWELYYKRHYDDMPYMRMRRAEFKYPSTTEIILHDDFKDNYLARLNASEEKLQFLLDEAVALEFEMRVHFCIGPDTEQIVKTTTGRQLSVAYRKDKGMKCVPFYGASSYEGSFEGIISVDLDVNVFHTLGLCTKYLNANYPEAEWKVVVSTLDAGPCGALGAGINYENVQLSYPRETYSCFTTQNYASFDVYPGCQYSLEAGMYTGLFTVDASYRNNYTHYPTFTRRGDEDGTSVLMIWEDGYKLKGLGEVLTVGLQHSVCSTDSDGDSRLVTRDGEVVGRIGMVTVNKPYDPKQEYLRINSDNPGHSHFQLFGLWVLADCIAAAENHQKVGWKAFMRTDSACTAWGERLDMTKVKVFQSASPSVYSYVVTENSSLTPPNLDEGCLVSVEGPTEYCGKYSMDLSFEDNFSYYPIMERKTFTIRDGDIVDEESNAFIKAERTAGGLVLKLYGLTKEYTISASSHMCETSHANGTKFPILNEEGTEVGNVYKLDPSAESCDPLPGVWKSKNEPTTSVSGDVSFADCLASLPKNDSSKKLAELVKTDGLCDAWDASMDSRDVTRQIDEDGQFDPGCTCVFSDIFANILEKPDANDVAGGGVSHVTSNINDVDRDCMAIVTDRVFHSPYAVKFAEGETDDFPLLVAKKIVRVGTSNSLTVGDFYDESEDGYRYIQYNPSSDQQQLNAKDGRMRDIVPDGFICFGAYDEPEPVYPVMDNDEMTGNVQRISGNVSCEILDTTNRDQIKLVVEQGITCLGDLGIVICSYGQSKKLVTCAEY